MRCCTDSRRSWSHDLNRSVPINFLIRRLAKVVRRSSRLAVICRLSHVKTNDDMPAVSETALVHQHEDALTSAAPLCHLIQRTRSARQPHPGCGTPSVHISKASRERRGISLHAISETHESQRGPFRRSRAMRSSRDGRRESIGGHFSATMRSSSVYRAIPR